MKESRDEGTIFPGVRASSRSGPKARGCSSGQDARAPRRPLPSALSRQCHSPSHSHQTLMVGRTTRPMKESRDEGTIFPGVRASSRSGPKARGCSSGQDARAPRRPLPSALSRQITPRHSRGSGNPDFAGHDGWVRVSSCSPSFKVLHRSRTDVRLARVTRTAPRSLAPRARHRLCRRRLRSPRGNSRPSRSVPRRCAR